MGKELTKMSMLIFLDEREDKIKVESISMGNSSKIQSYLFEHGGNI